MYLIKSLAVAVFLSFVASIYAAINTTNIPETSYLFSYFNDVEAGLRIAYSTDGYKFEALNHGNVVLLPKIGDKIMRDPCILYHDGVFHLVWTTSWGSYKQNEKPNPRGNEIGYASSRDLIHWSEEISIPVMRYDSQTLHTWAPEVIYDSDKKHYLIYFSSQVEGKAYNRIYSTTTTDFKTFTPTKLHYDGGLDTIDATLLQDPEHNDWLMFVKIENSIRLVKGKTPDGPWEKYSDSMTGHYLAEGPTAVKVGKYYNCYFDMFQVNKMGLVRSTDLIHWEEASHLVHFPQWSKHGTVFKVTPDVVRMLAKAGL